MPLLRQFCLRPILAMIPFQGGRFSNSRGGGMQQQQGREVLHQPAGEGLQ